ncbi:uncharacterized protein BcabD6B2_09660 [Babesia caballi]|uniref:Uncharacterized protein n=1 Tax=Babesia caballi TaxID=5871 RepID=A0AAV4LNA7_BABCB|nr:hypothetical protein BcabD6B2_09660 [Babesia caballi]
MSTAPRHLPCELRHLALNLHGEPRELGVHPQLTLVLRDRTVDLNRSVSEPALHLGSNDGLHRETCGVGVDLRLRRQRRLRRLEILQLSEHELVHSNDVVRGDVNVVFLVVARRNVDHLHDVRAHGGVVLVPLDEVVEVEQVEALRLERVNGHVLDDALVQLLHSLAKVVAHDFPHQILEQGLRLLLAGCDLREQLEDVRARHLLDDRVGRRRVGGEIVLLVEVALVLLVVVLHQVVDDPCDRGRGACANVARCNRHFNSPVMANAFVYLKFIFSRFEVLLRCNLVVCFLELDSSEPALPLPYSVAVYRKIPPVSNPPMTSVTTDVGALLWVLMWVARGRV